MCIAADEREVQYVSDEQLAGSLFPSCYKNLDSMRTQQEGRERERERETKPPF